ncbi:MAG: GGDEF domain-containing phosphodiesterase [Lachnospiraceae bacterium]|nr:GGDEF domain-containing phosphodiesterase [Lachnospiraceae bacterium]
MEHVNLNEYYSLLEKLTDSMNSPEEFSRKEFIKILVDICKLFDLSKGITEYYVGVWAERSGKGETLIDYDDKRGGKAALTRRIVTPNGAVIKSTLYRPDDAWALTEEEYKRMDLILRSLQNFICRNRLQSAVEKLTFEDFEGYPNQNSYYRYLEYLKENKGLYGHTALMYNLRNFSIINRDFGKKAGDLIIRRYYEAIRDVIGENGIICRLGGDNFVCVFKNDLLDGIVSILNGYPVSYDSGQEKRIQISACAGIFRIPENYSFDVPAEVIGQVYPITQEAKLEKQGTILFTDGTISDEKEKTQRIRSSFPEALEKDEFRAYYQPKVNILTGEITGAEALCRWFRDGRMIPPMDFIPVLEKTASICLLDFHILRLVCRDIRRWLDEDKPVVRISVNLSRKHLMDFDLVQHLVAILDEYRIPHEYIEFELTETTTDNDMSNLKRLVAGLHQEGIATAVDDFGTGYSSLSLIREIPWDVLKLDKGFLPSDGEAEDSVTSLMYRHVASMAHDIGLECVTEGVETLNQVYTLKNNKCMIAQGFYYDRPLPSEEFELRLQSGYPDKAIGGLSAPSPA